MIQNSNCPFTNTRLLQSIVKQQNNPYSSSISSLSNKSQLQPLNETVNAYLDRPSQITNTSLNYSADPLILEDIDRHHQLQFPQESLEIGPNQDNHQLLRELLACEEVTKTSSKTEYLQDNGQDQEDQPSTSQNCQANTSFDYSEDLHKLKLRIAEIEEMAQQEIARLKQQLIQQRSKFKETVDLEKDRVEVGVNTDPDLREVEVQMLRQSLIRHMALNKQLLQKQVCQKMRSCEQSLQNHMNSISL